MTALIEPGPVRRNVSIPTIDIAGIEWPRYKVHAVLTGVAVGLLALLITGSGQVTMWTTAVAVLAVWWGERLRQRAGDAATAPRSNPPGIS